MDDSSGRMTDKLQPNSGTVYKRIMEAYQQGADQHPVDQQGPNQQEAAMPDFADLPAELMQDVRGYFVADHEGVMIYSISSYAALIPSRDQLVHLSPDDLTDDGRVKGSSYEGMIADFNAELHGSRNYSSIDPLLQSLTVNDYTSHDFSSIQYRIIRCLQKSWHHKIPCYVKIICQHYKCPLQSRHSDDKFTIEPSSDDEDDCPFENDAWFYDETQSSPFYSLEPYSGQDYIREVTVYIDC